jgi:hypothetical protein
MAGLARQILLLRGPIVRLTIDRVCNTRDANLDQQATDGGRPHGDVVGIAVGTRVSTRTSS